MASGSFNFTTSNQYIVGKVSWASTPTTSTNSSSVKATVRMWRTNSGYTTNRVIEPTLTINGNAKSISQRFELSYNSNTLIMSHTVTVPHNADGSKSITINIKGTILAGSTGSAYTINSTNGTAKLDTIPRASQPRLSSSSRAIGQSVTIYTDRASTSFTHTITYKIGATTGTISSSAGASVSWTVPDVSNRITSSTSGTCTITCVTKSGSTTIGTKTVNLTITIPNAAPYLPTVSSITTSMVRGSGAPSGMTAFVSGYSCIKASMSGASAGKNASIKSYRLVINGVTYNSSSATSGVITKTGTVSVTARITDSRGRNSSVVTKKITFIAYTPPSISIFKAARQSVNTTVKVDWGVSYLNITGNSLTTKIETKLASSSSWTSFQDNTTSTSGSRNLTDVSDLVTQQFRLTSTDSFGGFVTRIISVGTARVAFSIREDYGIGVGKVNEGIAPLEVAGDIYSTDILIGSRARIADTLQPHCVRVCTILSGASTWYRCLTVETRYFMADIKILRGYSSPAPECYSVTLGVSYDKGGITVLSRIVNSQVVKQIRIVKEESGICHVDILYDWASHTNNVAVYSTVYPLQSEINYYAVKPMQVISSVVGTVVSEVSL